MLHKYLIVIPFDIPWDWPADYMKQTASRLSKENLVVCLFWNEAISLQEHMRRRQPLIIMERVSPALYHYRGVHFLPFRRLMFIQRCNLVINMLLLNVILFYLKHSQSIYKSIFWFFRPKFFAWRRFFLWVYYLL